MRYVLTMLFVLSMASPSWSLTWGVKGGDTYNGRVDILYTNSSGDTLVVFNGFSAQPQGCGTDDHFWVDQSMLSYEAKVLMIAAFRPTDEDFIQIVNQDEPECTEYEENEYAVNIGFLQLQRGDGGDVKQIQIYESGYVYVELDNSTNLCGPGSGNGWFILDKNDEDFLVSLTNLVAYKNGDTLSVTYVGGASCLGGYPQVTDVILQPANPY